MKELIIYCDESVQKGKFYGNFFGGALVESRNLERVKESLERKKQELNFVGEVKWVKVSAGPYCEKYISFVNTIFDLVQQNLLKIRIMFRQQIYVPTELTKEQRDKAYFLLYFQFLKHAFGLKYANRTKNEIYLRILMDQLPDTRERADEFKKFIYRLQYSKEFSNAKIHIRERDIGEIRSHDHVILQALDIVLGAMNFRLNDLYKEKLPGQQKRGQKTLAKEKVYKAIHKRINQIKPRFNVGVSTGGVGAKRWEMPYRHWNFVSKNHEVDYSKSKSHENKQSPVSST